MTHQFLSEEWMAAAHEIREKYADQVPPVTTVIKINQVIVDVPSRKFSNTASRPDAARPSNPYDSRPSRT